jgi:hypothetical protein
MAVFKAFGKGVVASTSRPRLLVDLWVINAGTAALVAAPFAFLFAGDLSHSILGEKLKSFDFMWIGEAVLKYQNAAPGLIGGVLSVALLFLLLYVFLNGGIIGRLLDGEQGTKLAAFAADCGRYFWRFLRLFLLSLPFYAVLFVVFGSLLGFFLRPWLEGARTEWTGVILGNLKGLVTLLALTLVLMVFDYAKIIVVAEDDPRSLHALGASLRFIGRHFFRAWGLYGLTAAMALGGTAAFILLDRLLPRGGWAFLVLGILAAQVYIVFRLWIKVLFFAAQAEYYRLTRF